MSYSQRSLTNRTAVPKLCRGITWHSQVYFFALLFESSCCIVSSIYFYSLTLYVGEECLLTTTEMRQVEQETEGKYWCVGGGHQALTDRGAGQVQGIGRWIQAGGAECSHQSLHDLIWKFILCPPAGRWANPTECSCLLLLRRQNPNHAELLVCSRFKLQNFK